MLATIRATVSEKTIEKVTRLFNQTMADAITELFQNARRAGANAISVTLDGTDAVVIQDNGTGIKDPQAILTLGSSGWNKETIYAEDPAGMGFFALAGRDVTVSSRAAGTATGWQATINADDWTGQNDITVGEVLMLRGTAIRIPFRGQERQQIETIVKAAAIFMPIEVFFEGVPVLQIDFLSGAIHIKHWNGCKIGVMKTDGGRQCRINFYGHEVKDNSLAPCISMEHGGNFYAFVDMGPSAIQFVLPARKELVVNEAYEDLKRACKTAIYEAIAALEKHSLRHENWIEANSLGVSLPEASPELYPWMPRNADYGHHNCFVPVQKIGWDTVVMCQQSPLADHCLDRALQGEGIRERLFEGNARFAGYSWYEKLPRIRHVAFHIDAENLHLEFDDEGDLDTQNELNCESQKVDRICIVLTIEEGRSQSTVTYPADFAAGVCERWGSDVDNLSLFWTDVAVEHFGHLLSLLEEGYFSPSDDCDADSHHTQRDDFNNELRPLLTKLMLGEREAAMFELKRVMDANRYFLPVGTRAVMTLDADGAHVEIIDEPALPAV